MRNAIPRAMCLAAGILLYGATSGFAAINFTLTSAGPANLGGVYTSPYVATIGSTSNVRVICDDFTDDVFVGESWTVTATNLSQLPLGGSSSPVLWETANTSPAGQQKQVTDYITAAILAEQLVTLNPLSLNAELLSYAIWDVFVPTSSSVLTTSSQSTVNSYLSAAQTQANDLVTHSATLADATANFANVMIYTADPKSGGAVTSCPAGKTCGAPQEFLVVSMAEPSAIVLLLMDLLAVFSLVCFFRKRQRGASLG